MSGAKKKPQKRGKSGFGHFIDHRLGELRLAGTPYEGNSASADFAKEWGALSEAERQEWDSMATSK